MRDLNRTLPLSRCSMWSKVALVALLLLSLPLVALPANAAEGERSQIQIQGTAELVALLEYDIRKDFSQEIERGDLFVDTKAGSCNGGTCATPSGTVLSCPTSGGPTCKTGQTCTCTCYTTNGSGGAWQTKNTCDGTPVEPAEPVVP